MLQERLTKLFQKESDLYLFEVAFLVNLGMSFHNIVKVTYVVATLELNQFYLHKQ